MSFDSIVVRNKNNETLQVLRPITAVNLEAELKALKQYADKNGGIRNHLDIADIFYSRCLTLKDMKDPPKEIRQFLAHRKGILHEKGYTADPYAVSNLFCARLALGLVDPSKPHPGWQFWFALLPMVFRGATQRSIRVLFADSLDDYPPYGEALLGEGGSNGVPTYLIHYKLVREKMVALGWPALQASTQPVAHNRGIFEARGTAPNEFFVLSKKFLSEDECRRVMAFDEQDVEIWRAARDSTNPIQVLKDIQNYYQFFEKVRDVFNKYRMANEYQNATSETEIKDDAQMAFSPFQNVMSSENYHQFHRYLEKQHKIVKDTSLKEALKLIIELRAIYTRVGKVGKEQVSSALNTDADYKSCFWRNASLLKSALQAIRPNNFPVEECILGVPFPLPWPLSASICGKDDIRPVEPVDISSVQDLEVLKGLINADKNIISQAVQRYRALFTTYKDFSNFIYELDNDKRALFIRSFFDTSPFLISKTSSSLEDTLWACNACEYAGGVETDDIKHTILSTHIIENENITLSDFNVLLSLPIAFSLNSRKRVRIEGTQLHLALRLSSQSKLERIARIIKFDICPGSHITLSDNVLPFSLLLKLLPREVKSTFEKAPKGSGFFAKVQQEDCMTLLEVFTTERDCNQSFEDAFYQAMMLIQSKTKLEDELDKQLAQLCHQSSPFAIQVKTLLKQTPSRFIMHMTNMKRWVEICDHHVAGGFRSILLKLDPVVRPKKTKSCIDHDLLASAREGESLFSRKECFDLLNEMLSSPNMGRVSLSYSKIFELSLGFSSEQQDVIQKLMFNQMSGHVKTVDDLEIRLRSLQNVSDRQLMISCLVKYNPGLLFNRGDNTYCNNDRIIDKLFLLPAVLIKQEEIAKALGAIWDRFSIICIVDLVRRHREPGRRPMGSVKEVLGHYLSNVNIAIWRIAFIEDETERQKEFLKEYGYYFNSIDSFKSMHDVCRSYGVVLTEVFPVLLEKFERFKKFHTCLRDFYWGRHPDISALTVTDWNVHQSISSLVSDAWDFAEMPTTSDQQKEFFAFKLMQKASGYCGLSDMSSFFHENKRLRSSMEVNEDHFVREYVRRLVAQNPKIFNLTGFMEVHRNHPSIDLSRKLEVVPKEIYSPDHTLRLMGSLDDKAERLCVLHQQSLHSHSLRRFKDVFRLLISCSMFGSIKYRSQLQAIEALRECSNLADLDNAILQDPLINKAWALSTEENIYKITYEARSMLPFFNRVLQNDQLLRNKVFDVLYKTEPTNITQTKGIFLHYHALDEKQKMKVNLYTGAGAVVGIVVAVAVMAYFYQNVLALAKMHDVALPDEAIIALSFVISALSGVVLFGAAVGTATCKIISSNRPLQSNVESARAQSQFCHQ